MTIQDGISIIFAFAIVVAILYVAVCEWNFKHNKNRKS